MGTRPDLLSFWSRLPFGNDVHPEDEDVFQSYPNALRTDFVPGPWYFNLLNARVYILQSNPGFVSHRDPPHYARGGELDQLMRRRLRGEEVELDLLECNRRSKTGGYEWANRMLRGVAGPEEQATRFCVFNLVAYRSPSSKDHRRVWDKLASTSLMRSVVHDDLLPRARVAELMVVCARGANEWSLRGQENTDTIRVLDRYEARGASLSANTSHGQAISRFLKQFT